VYGIPIALAGCALKYAEIEPVESVVYNGAEGLFDAKATETLTKIKQDVTRHRYGDEAHLDTTVKRLGLVVPGKAYPQLVELREENEGGELGEDMMTGGQEERREGSKRSELPNVALYDLTQLSSSRSSPPRSL